MRKTAAKMLSSSDKFLLISAKPAPNGELHLGHLSGPFLNQDMFYRHLTSIGADVKVMSGTDPIDSFIPLIANTKEETSDSIANQYFSKIGRNFASYNFHYDSFVNPLDDQWKERFTHFMAEIFEKAKTQDLINEIHHPFPYSASEKNPSSGSWIIGSCPDCHEDISGYFCEDCGAHIEPFEIINPRHRMNKEEIDFLEVNDYFFEIRNLDSLINKLEESGVRDSELGIVKKQFLKGRTKIRLTEDSSWGIPFNDSRKKYFGHGLLYAYCRFIGEIYKNETNSSCNPFDEEADVTTINFFGIDNTSSHMINIQAIGHGIEGWKGFDHFVVNHFYLLEGKKFSTSANHLISASEILNKSEIMSDSVRFILAVTSPMEKQVSLEFDSFLHYHNEVLVKDIVVPIQSTFNELYEVNLTLHTSSLAFTKMWDLICANYDVKVFNPTTQVNYLLTYCKESKNLNSANEKLLWLIEMAIITYAFCPDLASQMWKCLGLDDKPNLSIFERKTEANVCRFKSDIQAILEDDLKKVFGRISSNE